MQVKWIGKSVEGVITNGKVYDAVDLSGWMYQLTDDSDRKVYLPKKSFENMIAAKKRMKS